MPTLVFCMGCRIARKDIGKPTILGPSAWSRQGSVTCDQIGLLVQHIDNEGFIYAQPIGGWDPQVLIGQRMTIWSADGPVMAIIARKPIHLLTDEERKQAPKLKDLWLDIGAKDKDDAL